MRTLGIDLASSPDKTAACVVDWDGGGLDVVVGCDDARLLALAAGVEWIGIDAPFGWPDAFVELVSRHHRGKNRQMFEWSAEHKRSLRLRETDRWVNEHVFGGKKAPLSVSTDRLALPALRCVGLLTRLRDRAIEAYPAAALYRWGLRHQGYKGRRHADRLAALASGLEAATGLTLPPRAHADDDAFDAVVCAIIARCDRLGLTDPAPPGRDQVAAREGWITVPRAGSEARLAFGPGEG